MTALESQSTDTAMTIDSALGQIVAQQPSAARIFEGLGLDYCCGGKRSLAEACAEKGLDASTVLALLPTLKGDANDGKSCSGRATGSATSSAAPAINPLAMTLTQLVDHIEATHHAYLKTELPNLCMMAGKVAKAHDPNHPETHQVHQVTLALASEMQQHMMKEEQVLFPMIRQLEASTGAPSFHCGSVANPIRMMEFEHDSAGNALARLRNLTVGFTAPADACGTFRTLLAGLARLESDLHQHVHKENNVLFPRAIELESRRRAGK